MSKTKKLSKVLALILMLALVIGVLPMGAMATTSITVNKNSRTFYDASDNAVATVTVTGNSKNLAGISDWGETSSTAKDFVISLSPSDTAASVTVLITPVSNTAVSKTIGVGTSDTITAGGVTYTVTVQQEDSYSGTMVGNAILAVPGGENTTLTYNSSGSGTSADPYSYTAACTVYSYPFSMSLRIIPKGANFDDLTSFTYSFNDEDTDASLNYFCGTYFVASFPSATAKLTFSINYSGSSATYYEVSLDPTSGQTPSAGGIYAFLPAPGQFANEGINTGGWGDAFIAGSTNLKSMVDANVSTGISLGFFGGYAVFDLGTKTTTTGNTFTPVVNNPNNPYGVDFIVYGNAFAKNSEPGCIQVARGVEVKENGVTVGYVPGDVNSDGVIWYDIAGSLHYASTTKWDAVYTYTNPHPGDDDPALNPPQSGTVGSPNSSNNVSYTYSYTGTSGAGNVTYNTFHQHAWFPLYANYFKARNGIGPMDQASIMDANGVVTTEKLPFAKYHHDDSSGSKLTFTGVMLGSATNTQTGNYTFGYADVHPNGTNYGVAANPYAAGANTNGGDGIDISWAVYPAKYDHTVTKVVGGQTVTYTAGNANPLAGQPVELDDIYFVRIYTGAAYMNGVFGEISTEVCGVYVASGTGSGAPTASTNSVYISGPTTVGLNPSGGVQVLAGTYTITSNATYIFVNGVPFTSGNTVLVSAGNPVQIITQTGTESPRVILLYV